MINATAAVDRVANVFRVAVAFFLVAACFLTLIAGLATVLMWDADDVLLVWIGPLGAIVLAALTYLPLGLASAAGPALRGRTWRAAHAVAGRVSLHVVAALVVGAGSVEILHLLSAQRTKDTNARVMAERMHQERTRAQWDLINDLYARMEADPALRSAMPLVMAKARELSHQPEGTRPAVPVLDR